MVKILIMDDEPALRNIVYNILKPLGHQMFTAEDGKQAIEIAHKEIPDLAMLDMRVPDMDGLEVLAELKKINPSIRAIMLSGFGDVDTAVGALKQGAFDYISKPFKVDEVMKVVNKALAAGQQGGPVAAAPQAVVAPAAAPAPAAASQPVAAQKPAAVPVSAGAKSKMPLIAGIVAGALLLAGVGFVAMKKFSRPSAQEFTIPYTNPIGMCWIKPNLWVSDWVVGNMYQHNADATLSIVSVLKTNNTQPTGIAFDGEFMWTCSSVEKRIYKHKMDATLSVQAIYETPNTSPAGLYFDGANLWVIDTNAAKIYKHKMDEVLSVLGAYDSPAVNPCGMFKDGESFYIGDYKTSRIYKVLVKDFSTMEVFSVPGFEDGKYKLASIAWDGQNIWASVDSAGKVLRFSKDSLKPIKF